MFLTCVSLFVATVRLVQLSSGYGPMDSFFFRFRCTAASRLSVSRTNDALPCLVTIACDRTALVPRRLRFSALRRSRQAESTFVFAKGGCPITLLAAEQAFTRKMLLQASSSTVTLGRRLAATCGMKVKVLQHHSRVSSTFKEEDCKRLTPSSGTELTSIARQSWMSVSSTSTRRPKAHLPPESSTATDPQGRIIEPWSLGTAAD
mmetsp:Transcript_40724/g.113153  ORF Transcript_40724/g.113153 Transcript_40724/m.113153 type:complete len:205 (-) Transcript_40724:37-651(-)